MHDLITFSEEQVAETVIQLDSPEKRRRSLSGSFAMSIAIIAQMEANRDWEVLTREDGSPYLSLVELVQDALNISQAWARKMIQTSERLYSPLEAIVIQSTQIPITSSQANELSGGDMDALVERIEPQLDDTQTPQEQAEIISSATQEFIDDKAKKREQGEIRNTGGAYQPEDFDDVSGEDIASFTPTFAMGTPMSSESEDAFEDDFFDDAPSPQPQDFISHIKAYLKAGETYTQDCDIDTLPTSLQEFVRALNVIADMNPDSLAGMVEPETRGVIKRIDRAHSNLSTFKSLVETSPWVLAQI